MATTEEVISNVYHDVDNGYGSVKNTFDQAKRIGATITLEHVNTWMGTSITSKLDTLRCRERHPTQNRKI